MDTITVVYPLYCTYYIRNNKRYFTAHGAQVIVVCPLNNSFFRASTFKRFHRFFKCAGLLSLLLENLQLNEFARLSQTAFLRSVVAVSFLAFSTVSTTPRMQCSKYNFCSSLKFPIRDMFITPSPRIYRREITLITRTAVLVSLQLIN